MTYFLNIIAILTAISLHVSLQCDANENDVADFIFNNNFRYWNRPVQNFSDSVIINLTLKLLSLTDVVGSNWLFSSIK